MTEPWRTCRDCAATTFRCPVHSTWFEVIPAITIIPETVVIPATIIPPTYMPTTLDSAATPRIG
jgi:hypothetical protein